MARIRQDEGCVCNGKTIKPIKIRYMGLIDPVATGGLQMVGTNSTVVPAKAGSVVIVYAGLQSKLGWWLFNAKHPKPENQATTVFEATFDIIHEDIGIASLAPSAQGAIENGAKPVGVPFK
jgi:hypothetical protein